MKTISIFFLIICSFSGITIAEKYEVDSIKLFNYANSAFQEKDYKRAVDEFKRFIFYFPDDTKNKSAKYMISLSYFSSGDFTNCIKNLRELIDLEIRNKREITSKESILYKAIMLSSRCYEKQGKIQLAANEIRNILMLSEDKNINDLVYYETAILFFSHGQFYNANFALEKINPSSEIALTSDTLKKSIMKSRNLPEKSPFVAGFLSVIPGCGYIYTGRYRDGFVSFIFNGLLIFAAVEAFDSGNDGLGSLITFVETGFYLGNIYGSYNSAKKYNTLMRNQFIERERSRLRFSISNDPVNKIFLVNSELRF